MTDEHIALTGILDNTSQVHCNQFMIDQNPKQYVGGQLIEAAFQLVKRDQCRIGCMKIIPLFLRAHIQKEDTLLVKFVGLVYGYCIWQRISINADRCRCAAAGAGP